MVGRARGTFGLRGAGRCHPDWGHLRTAGTTVRLFADLLRLWLQLGDHRSATDPDLRDVGTDSARPTPGAPFLSQPQAHSMSRAAPTTGAVEFPL
jgi:hypothetical protein